MLQFLKKTFINTIRYRKHSMWSDVVVVYIKEKKKERQTEENKLVYVKKDERGPAKNLKNKKDFL